LTTNISSKNRSSTKAFTERGLYMIATILKGDRARAISFAIIETFAKIRELKRELLEKEALLFHLEDVGDGAFLGFGGALGDVVPQ